MKGLRAEEGKLKEKRSKNPTLSALDVSGRAGNQGLRQADFPPLIGFLTAISIKDLTPFLRGGRKICTVFIYVGAQLLTGERHCGRMGEGRGSEGGGGRLNLALL